MLADVRYALQSFIESVRSPYAPQQRSACLLDAVLLEDRVLFSAGPLPADLSIGLNGAAPDGPFAVDVDAAVNQFELDVNAQAAADTTVSEDSSVIQQTVRRELVFVDTAAANYQQLVDDLLSTQEDDRKLDVILLDSTRDGIEQISETLAEYSDLDAVHLVSHGADGRVKLGNTWLAFNSLDGYAGDIAAWNGALRDGADLLIYGCDLASNEDGRGLAEALSELCDCDVAASVDDTGHGSRGGDWDLEFATGFIETRIAFSQEAQASWFNLLALETYQQGINGYAGTQDTYIDSADPSSPKGTLVDIKVDIDDIGQGLIRFDGIVGLAEIPLGSTINSATLTLNMSDPIDNSVSIHQMLVDWNQASTTWNGWFGGDGIQADDLEAAAAADDVRSSGSGTVDFDVTSSLQAWADGDPNFGWVLLSSSIDTAKAFSSEASGLEPLLEVDFTPAASSLIDSLWIVDEATTIAQRYLGTLESPDTIGTFSAAFDLAAFGATTNLSAIHYVGSTINMSGVGITTMTLNPGDLILSVDGTTTVGGLAVNTGDLFVFRPATSGDYSSGSFTMLAANIGLGSDVTAVTLIERDTAVPTAVEPSGTLQKGSFLYTAGTGQENRQVRYYDLATGGNSFVIDGDTSDPNGFKPGNNVIAGIELVESGMTVGGRSFSEGQILVSLAEDDASVGTNTISVVDQDIFVLTLTSASTWTAEIAFDGTQAGFPGDVHGLTFAVIAANNPPTATDNSHSIAADAVAPATGNVITDDDGSGVDNDPDGDPIHVSQVDGVTDPAIDVVGSYGTLDWDTDGDYSYTIDNGNTAVQSLAVGVTLTETFAYKLGDDSSAIDTAALTITITGTNDGATANDDAYSTNEDTALNVIVPASWFDTSWSARQQLTFDNLAQTENLADFPVLIQLDATRIDYSKTQNAGEDLRFVDASGAVLDYEIESWDAAGTSYVWVKVPEVLGSSNTDYIWMYYDNAAAPDGQNPSGVWSGSYQAVYHLNENPAAGGVLADATLNAFDATNQSTTDAGGVIGHGQEFDASNSQYIDLGADRAFLNNVSAATLSAWVQPDTLSGQQEVVAISRNSGGPATTVSRASIRLDGNEITVFADTLDDTSTAMSTTTSSPLVPGQWQLVTAVIDYANDSIRVFVDGVEQTMSGSVNFTNTATPNTNSTNSTIGSQDDGSANYFDGRIDEVRVAATDRSADWIAAQYLSTTDNFVTFGSVEGIPGLLANDTDPDTGALAVTNLNTMGTVGNVSVNADGSFTYDPNGQFEGLAAGETATDTFFYTAYDGTVDSNVARVTITINGANDAPTADNDTASISEDAAATDITAILLTGDTDPDTSDSLTITAVDSSGTLGTVTRMAGVVSYDPNGQFEYLAVGETATETFSYTIDDGNGATDTATVAIIVTGVNDGPTATDNVNAILESAVAPVTGNVIGDDDGFGVDSDPDTTNTLSVSRVNGVSDPAGDVVGSYGTLDWETDGSYSYTVDNLNPAVQTLPAGRTLQDVFSYTLSDVSGATDAAKLTITITGINNDPPVADDESFTVLEGGTATEADLDAGLSLLDGDTDLDLPFDALDIDTTPDVGPGHGSLTLNADGTFVYTHDGSENFTDSFTYHVHDAAGNTDTATVTITVTPQNDNPPVADDESFTVLEGGTATEADLDAGLSLLDGDTDLDLPFDALDVDIMPDVAPAHGSLTLNADGTFVYTHDGSENFTDSFQYHVHDAAGNTDTATVTITISGTNDAPHANDDNYSVPEDGNLTATSSVLANDTDVDSVSLTAVLVGGPDHGSVALGSDGTFSYTPDDDFFGTDSFTYKADDGLAHSNLAVVTITVLPKNDAPVANSDIYDVNGGATLTVPADGLLANDTDVDSGVLTATLVDPATEGTLTVAANGSFVYQPDINFVGTDSFTYIASDGSLDSTAVTVQLHVHAAVGPPPPASPPSESSSGGSDPNPSESSSADSPAPPIDAGIPAPEEDDDDEDLGPAERSRSLEDTQDPPQRTVEVPEEVTDPEQDAELLLLQTTAWERWDRDPHFRWDPGYIEVQVSTLQDALHLADAVDYFQALDSVDHAMEAALGATKLSAGAAGIVTLSLSAGYALITIRAGYMLSSLLASMPAWHVVDPLPILTYLDDREDEDDETLESLVGGSVKQEPSAKTLTTAI